MVAADDWWTVSDGAAEGAEQENGLVLGLVSWLKSQLEILFSNAGNQKGRNPK